MNKLLLTCALAFGLLSASISNAATGEVDVTLQISPDQATWSAAAEGVKTVTTPPVYFRASIVPVDGGEVTYSNVVQSTPTAPWLNVNVSLESSPDLASWSDSVVGVHDVSGGKEFYRASVRSIYGDMVFVEGGTMTGIANPVADFWIGRYEVSREEWDVVYAWALNNGYTFFDQDPTNPSLYAVGCAPNHPVTKITWYDIAKWCNAKSEMDQLTPVYQTGSGVYRTGNVDLLDNQSLPSANGYRLPFRDEWVYAARGGVLSQDFLYSGSNTADDIAIYSGNSSGAECESSGIGTWPLASKGPNELGIFDMSGNVWEMTNDWEGLDSGSRRVRLLGSSFGLWPTLFLQTNVNGISGPTVEHATDWNDVGFRLVKNIPVIVSAAVESSSSLKTGKKPSKSKTLKSSRK